MVGHNASEGIEPRNISIVVRGQGVHVLEASNLSSILSNIFLHEVLDVWFGKEIKPK